MTFNLILALAYDAALVLTCGYAFVLGGRPERIGAAINLIATGVTILLRYHGVASGAPAELAVLTVDLCVVGGFYWLAIRTTRFWPIWAFGFAMADVVTSAAGRLMPATPLFAYHTGLGIYGYLALAALVAGTARLPRGASRELRRGNRSPCSPPNQMRST